MLRDLQFKSVYRSGYDNLISDFYIPALSNAKRYDRAVGYFSAGTLCSAAQGITAFCENGGKIRLIVGAELDIEDAQTILDGYVAREFIETLNAQLLKEFQDMEDLGSLFQHRQKALLWLVGNDLLDVKIALRKKGIFHEKIGIIYDENEDFVLFQGSANETVQGLVPGFNGESINVFQSWNEHLESHITPHREEFDALWNDEAPFSRVIEFSNASLESLIKDSLQDGAPSVKIEVSLFQNLYDELFPESEVASVSGEPRVPAIYKGAPFDLLPHQKRALGHWRANDYRGILALATGAGKTITAIYAAVSLYHSIKKSGGRLALIIAVPYINLADQWVDELTLFNIEALECYRSSSKWLSEARMLRLAFSSGAKDFICLVVVNKTLGASNFQNIIKDLPSESLMWVGDECHWHSTEKAAKAVKSDSKLILGLSATPEHYSDEEANRRLYENYGDIVDRYELSDALSDGVLTPYVYFPFIVELTVEEADVYIRLTKKLSPLLARTANGERLSPSERSYLDSLLMTRSRLLGAAKNKLVLLDEILSERAIEKGTLFYCGDGSVEGDTEDFEEPTRQIELVSEILHKRQWVSSRFTSKESPVERRRLMKAFARGTVDALVAIRCLDEGVDIPMCNTAFILASSKNPRQFVQRRGRILRKYPNKDKASIIDFLVKMPVGVPFATEELEESVLGSEMGRVFEFSKLALNEIDALDVLKKEMGEEKFEYYLQIQEDREI
jgi:superfamily II DNA or RNA helicase